MRLVTGWFVRARPSPRWPGDALYVVAGGGNNARDALMAAAACLDEGCINGGIQATALSYAGIVAAIVAERSRLARLTS